VIWVNNVELDVLVEAPSFEVLSERIEWDSHDLPVKVFALRTEPFEVFNTDVGVILQRKIGDVPHDFPNPVLDEVMLFPSEDSKLLSCRVASEVCVALKDVLTLEYSLTLHPNVFAEVELLEDFAFGCENGCGEAFAVHVHTDHVSAGFDFSFSGEEGNYLPVCGESVSLARPTEFDKVGVALKVPVPVNGHGSSLSWVHNELDEQVLLGFKDLTVSRYIKLDGNVFEDITLTPDYAPFNVADYLTSEGGGFLAG
jgi:hypothetical protein